MPALSKGCNACRRMKVKCDEAKPVCQRCANARRECVYRDPGELVFRSMNPTEDGSMKTTPAKSSATPSPEVIETVQRPVSLTSIRPSITWEQQALALFFDNYVLEPMNGRRGNLDFLPALYNQSVGNDCLDRSLKAVSMAALANKMHADALHTSSQIYYGEALSALKTSLNDPQEARTDQILTSVVLLQLYELISGTHTAGNDPHDAGIDQILQVRQAGEASNAPNGSLLQAIESMRQLKGLNEAPLAGPASATAFIGPAIATTPGLALLKLLPRVTAACRRLHASCSALEIFGAASLETSLDAGFEALAETVLWRSALPPDWLYEDIEASISYYVNPVDRPPERQLLFKDIQHGAVWVAYWCARIHLLLALLRASKILKDQPGPLIVPQSIPSLREDLLAMMLECRASAPYMLGEVNDSGEPLPPGSGKAIGAFYFLNALCVLMAIPFLPAEARDWILEQMLSIGRNHGIGQAFTLRNMWLAREQGDVA